MKFFDSIGVDLGYSFVKMVYGNNEGDYLLYPSVYYVTYKSDDDFNYTSNFLPRNKYRKDKMIIDHNNVRYYIGEIAEKEERGGNKDFSEIKFDKPHEIAKLLAGIALISDDDLIQIEQLVLGLDISKYNTYKDQLINTFADKKFEFFKHRKKIEIKINNAIAVPQGIGAYWDQVFDLNGKIVNERFLSGRYGLIDIGGRTVDGFIADESEPLRGTKIGFTSGLSEVFKEAVNELEIDIPFNILEKKYIEGQESVFWIDREYNIREICENAIKRLAERIYTEVRYVWDRKIDRAKSILLCGGGAKLVGNHLVDLFNKEVIVVTNPQFSNARGYYKAGLVNNKNGYYEEDSFQTI